MKTSLLILTIAISFVLRANEDFLEAISQNKVSYSISYKSFGEKGISLNIKNLTANVISLSIAPGTIFLPESDDEQTLMNADEQLIVLRPKAEDFVLVDGYCINYNKLAPSEESTYKIKKTNNPNLIALLDYFKQNPISKDNYQAAIWAVSDNEDIAYIEPITESDKGVRELIAKMTNRPNPWYSKDEKIEVEPRQVIARGSSVVEGILSMTPEKDVEVYVTVENSNMEQIRDYPGMKFDKGWSTNLRFKIAVSGWEKGNYTATIRDKATGEGLKTFEFSI
ncbi:MAG: hypothetical protein H3C31_00220 [Brumimicrobium sp.]|nr:hypothetical protein [Brumimicrobium sp.]MCO5268065.1 thioester domain-containing protein [Brumimicrobium sp.]